MVAAVGKPHTDNLNAHCQRKLVIKYRPQQLQVLIRKVIKAANEEGRTHGRRSESVQERAFGGRSDLGMGRPSVGHAWPVKGKWALPHQSPLSVFVKSKESVADEQQKPSFLFHTFQY